MAAQLPRRGFLAGIAMVPGLAAAAQAAGRLKDMTIRPGAGDPAFVVPTFVVPTFVVNGFYWLDGATHGVRAASVPVAREGRQFIVGDGDGRVWAEAEAPGRDRALLAMVRPPGPRWSGRAHASWLTLFPPLDDTDAQRRKAAYDRGEFRIPGRDVPVGPSLDRPTLDQYEDLTLRPEWRNRSFYLAKPRNEVRHARLAGGALYCTNVRGQANTYDIQDVVVDAAPTVAGCVLSDIDAGRAGFQSELILRDAHLTSSAPMEAGSPAGVLFYGRTRLRNVLVDTVQHGIQNPGFGSSYEDLVCRRIGARANDHGNAFYVAANPTQVQPNEGGQLAAGHFTVRGFNIDMPTEPSPDWVSGQSTAAITLWGSNAYPIERIVFEHGRIDGGTYSIALQAGATEGTPIRDITFRQVWMGRSYWYDSSTGARFFQIHRGLGRAWGNVRLEDIFWEDTGELVEEVVGTWNPDSTGRPVRA